MTRSPRIQQLDEERLRMLQAAPFSYPDVGATQRQALPLGWPSTHRRMEAGRGRERFQALAEDLLGWRLHQRSGLAMQVSDERVRTGAVSVAGFGIGPFRIHAPCRVVYLITEERRVAFAYGTLPGHPLAGEERFEVRWDADDAVRFELRLFSRPASPAARLGGSVTTWMQSLVNNRYFSAVQDH